MSPAEAIAEQPLRCDTCGAGYPAGTRFCKRDGALLGAPPADPLIGKVVGGRYVMQRKLGEGGMGAVYAAEHTLMHRPVALKVMRGSLAGDPVTAARFAREAQLVARLRVPEIVQVFDSGVSGDGRFFIAMELLEGETLRERLERGALPWPEARHVASAILRALAEAHAAAVVHRDLKPDNVFLCRDGGVKVLDFGIARVVAGSEEPVGPSVTATGAIVGTALYVSPEAVARAPVGPAADLYSFGAMLFEMLAGGPPFYDEQPVLLMGMHLRVPPPRLSERTSTVFPEGLEDIVERLLAKRPDERPTLDETRAVLEGLPLAPAPRRSSANATQRGHADGRAKLLLLGAALAAIAGASTGILLVVGWSGGPVELAPAELPARAVEPAPPPAPVPEPPPVATPPSPPEVVPDPPVAPARMVLRGSFEPASAWAELDGARITLPHEMPADGALHTLVVQAEGYVPVTRTFVAERDRDVDLVLTRRARSEPRALTTPRVGPFAPVATLPPRAPPAGNGMTRQYP